MIDFWQNMTFIIVKCLLDQKFHKLPKLKIWKQQQQQQQQRGNVIFKPLYF